MMLVIFNGEDSASVHDEILTYKKSNKINCESVWVDKFGIINWKSLILASQGRIKTLKNMIKFIPSESYNDFTYCENIIFGLTEEEWKCVMIKDGLKMVKRLKNIKK